MEKVEKIENEESSLLHKLTSPLGFGGLVLASTAIGFGFAFLQHRLKKGKRLKKFELQKLTEKLISLVEEEKESETYSDELIKLTYTCASLSKKIQKECSILVKKSFQERIKVLDDPDQYREVFDGFSSQLSQLLIRKICSIITDCRGDQKRFIASSFGRMRDSDDLRSSFYSLSKLMQSRSLMLSEHQNQTHISDNLAKEVFDYELGLYQDPETRQILKKLKDKAYVFNWVFDQIFQKFGIDGASKDFNIALVRLRGVDDEFRQKATIYRNLHLEVIGQD